MRIVRELAAERNSVAKIAFLIRLTEEAVRDVLGLAAAAGAEVRECLSLTAAPHVTSTAAVMEQAALRSSHAQAPA
jgi:hypothetical protein